MAAYKLIILTTGYDNTDDHLRPNTWCVLISEMTRSTGEANYGIEPQWTPGASGSIDFWIRRWVHCDNEQYHMFTRAAGMLHRTIEGNTQ